MHSIRLKRILEFFRKKHPDTPEVTEGFVVVMNKEEHGKPVSASFYGKCSQCGRDKWLFQWDNDEPVCGDCIDCAVEVVRRKFRRDEK
jgi:hypothetical protein